MIPPRDLMPGNADLRDVAERLRRPGSLLARRPVVSTICLVVTTLVWVVLLLGLILPRMEAVLVEIGRPIPPLSALVFSPWFHLVLGGVMLGLVAWRYLQPQRWWIATVAVIWFAIHVIITVVGLFMPMMGLMEQVG